MSYRDQLRAARDLTEPTEAELGRVRERLAQGLEPTTELFRDGPRPTAAMAARVRGRLQERPQRWGMPLTAGLALAAAALLAIGVSAWAPTEASTEVEPQTVALGSGSAELAEVVVRADGVGEAVGAGPDWSMDWTRGALAVEVPPDGRHTVVVRTPEAEVRVVGTVFEVERDALGTAVAVSRGSVEVACTVGDEARLEAGDSVRCLPATASGLLGRARALADGGEAPDAILDALDRGLALDAEVGVRGELLAARIGPLVALERSAEALVAAEQYLALGVETRDASVRRAAAALALSLEGCQRALPHLEGLAEPTPAELAQRDACRAP